MLGELDRIRAEGGKVIVIDPRRTGTVRHASEWIPIVPGTDAALLLAIVNVLYADGLVDLGGLADILAGRRRSSRALAAQFTPERVADACQIPAERIRELAHEIAAAKHGVVYGRIGLCNQEFGTLASWLVDVVNILTASFDVPGGLMFPTPVNWTVNVLPTPAAPGTPGSETGPEFGRWRSRVRGAPEVLGQVPVSCLAEEIDTPGDGQIKALITVAGNPALSAPGAERLQAALPLLDAMISVDNWINETTKHAARHPAGPAARSSSRTSMTCCGCSPSAAQANGPTPSSRRRTGGRGSGRSWCGSAASSPGRRRQRSMSPPSTTRTSTSS